MRLPALAAMLALLFALPAVASAQTVADVQAEFAALEKRIDEMPPGDHEAAKALNVSLNETLTKLGALRGKIPGKDYAALQKQSRELGKKLSARANEKPAGGGAGAAPKAPEGPTSLSSTQLYEVKKASDALAASRRQLDKTPAESLAQDAKAEQLRKPPAALRDALARFGGPDHPELAPEHAKAAEYEAILDQKVAMGKALTSETLLPTPAAGGTVKPLGAAQTKELESERPELARAEERLKKVTPLEMAEEPVHGPLVRAGRRFSNLLAAIGAPDHPELKADHERAAAYRTTLDGLMAEGKRLKDSGAVAPINASDAKTLTELDGWLAKWEAGLATTDARMLPLEGNKTWEGGDFRDTVRDARLKLGKVAERNHPAYKAAEARVDAWEKRLAEKVAEGRRLLGEADAAVAAQEKAARDVLQRLWDAMGKDPVPAALRCFDHTRSEPGPTADEVRAWAKAYRAARDKHRAGMAEVAKVEAGLTTGKGADAPMTIHGETTNAYTWYGRYKRVGEALGSSRSETQKVVGSDDWANQIKVADEVKADANPYSYIESEVEKRVAVVANGVKFATFLAILDDEIEGKKEGPSAARAAELTQRIAAIRENAKAALRALTLPAMLKPGTIKDRPELLEIATRALKSDEYGMAWYDADSQEAQHDHTASVERVVISGDKQKVLQAEKSGGTAQLLDYDEFTGYVTVRTRGGKFYVRPFTLRYARNDWPGPRRPQGVWYVRSAEWTSEILAENLHK